MDMLDAQRFLFFVCEYRVACYASKDMYHPTHARLNNFHGPKRRLLGNKAGNAPPAWRDAAPAITTGIASKGKQVVQSGSRIFISNLPLDVVEKEVEELFKKTVGPLKEVFLIYNNQGKSKGMAIVTFQRVGDAAVARTKYNGKIVDGRRPIKIEIIIDSTNSPQPSTTTAPPSLFSRLAPPPAQTINNSTPLSANSLNGRVGPPIKTVPVATQPVRVNKAQLATQPLAGPSIPPKRRIKKGPRRINKRQAIVAKSKEDLDREMDDYQASTDA